MTSPAHDEHDGRDDPTLIAAYLEGDQGAFSELYRRHRDRTFAVSYGLVGNRETALDVTQDVWCRLVTRLRQYDGRAAFTTWLHRIAVNRSYDALRARSRRPEPVAEIPEDPVVDPDVALGIDVHKAMTQLSDDHRTIVVLHDFQGLRYEEIASTLDIAVGTVKSRLARARSRLGDLLGEPGPSAPSLRPAGGGPDG